MNVPSYTLTTSRDPIIAEGLDWLEDCFPDQVPADMTDDEIMLAVDRYHDNGWNGFARLNEILVAHLPDYVTPEPLIRRRRNV
jgi:hypothetical protein